MIFQDDLQDCGIYCNFAAANVKAGVPVEKFGCLQPLKKMLKLLGSRVCRRLWIHDSRHFERKPGMLIFFHSSATFTLRIHIYIENT